MKVALLIVATGKYERFIADLCYSAEKFFMAYNAVNFHVFTDKEEREWFNYHYHKVEHKPWPYATLNRFHFFKQYEQSLQDTDYLFYIDVDTLIKAPITSEILSDRTAVQHCGFVNVRGSYETNPLSTSYVAPDEGSYYFGGGFWGFSKAEFWKFINKAIEMINEDAYKGIVPVHNDESVLNRYLIDNPPTLMLSPSYHYPQSELAYYRKIWKQDYECKILLLDKNHEELRS
jgi:histo-blood group ABO system transferase